MTRISELLPSEAVKLELEEKDKVAVIRELARPLVDDGTITDEKTFFEAILRRENIESTGIGLGVAIPHARAAGVTRTALAFGRSETGIDFGSLDGKPCHLVFLIASPEDRKAEYIITLARVSKLLRRDDVRSELLKAASADDIAAILDRNE